MTHSFPTRRSSELSKRGSTRSSGPDVAETKEPEENDDNGKRKRRTAVETRVRPTKQKEATAMEATATKQPPRSAQKRAKRSEEHTSEIQSLMRTPYAVFCVKKKNTNNKQYN